MSSRSGSLVRCVGTGIIALDIVRSALDDGATPERCHAGGSCGNVLANLSYLGLRSIAVGRIGDDAAGKRLTDDLGRFKVDVGHLVREHDRPTPIVIQDLYLDRHGNPRHRFHRACPVCGAFLPKYRPLRATDVPAISSALPAHEFFFFDRVARGNLELAKRSRSQGALVVFEPSRVRNEELFVECLRTSHVLKYSRERISSLDAFVARARPLLEVATDSAEGLRFRIRASDRMGGWTRLPALEAPEFRDSVGSGDWCTAGLIFCVARMSRNAEALIDDIDVLKSSLRFGQALAAVNCGYDGARGMMYKMPRSKALRATERVIDHETTILPENPVACTSPLEAGHNCVLCAQA